MTRPVFAIRRSLLLFLLPAIVTYAAAAATERRIPRRKTRTRALRGGGGSSSDRIGRRRRTQKEQAEGEEGEEGEDSSSLTFSSSASLSYGGGNAERRLVRSVILARHCPRAPLSFPETVRPTPGYPTTLDRYANASWPTQREWGVAAGGECTAAGRDHARALGQSLASSSTMVVQRPISFTVDGTSKRVNTTADMLRKGLEDRGLNVSGVDYSDIFGTTTCRSPFDPTEAWRSIVNRITSHPKPAFFGNLIDMLQDALGRRTTDNNNNATNTDDVVLVEGMGNTVILDDGAYVGQTSVAATLSEIFLMQRMSGNVTNATAWGRLSDAEIMSLVRLANYNRAINDGGPYHAKRRGTALLQEMLDKLFLPWDNQGNDDDVKDGNTTNTTTTTTTAGSHVFVGHAGNIAAINGMLGLYYNDPNYGMGAATPLSRLQFDLWSYHTPKNGTANATSTNAGDDQENNGAVTITATFYSVDLDGNETRATGTPVRFRKLGGATEINATQLRGLFRDGMDASCLVHNFGILDD